MKIQRVLINQAKGDAWEQKALSLAIWLKSVLRNSRLERFSLNRLSKISGISYRALKIYLHILQERGYIEFEGNRTRKTLVIKKLSSKRDKRNICVKDFNFSSFKDVYNSFRAYIVMKKQANKDYIKHLLQIYHNPKRNTNFRAVRRKVRNLVRCGILKSMYSEYKEFGLSLKRLAEEVGCCIRTVQRVVNYGIKNGWMTKEHHWEQVYAPKVNYMYVEGYTFSTKNNLYVVRPNTYTLHLTISGAFGMVVY